MFHLFSISQLGTGVDILEEVIPVLKVPVSMTHHQSITVVPAAGDNMKVPISVAHHQSVTVVPGGR